MDCALRREGGLVGNDEEQGDRLRAIEFDRVAGGKPFDTSQVWFTDLLRAIGMTSLSGSPGCRRRPAPALRCRS